MHSPDPSQVQFEEAVVVGAVFSPSLLTALPFLPYAGASIAVIACLAVLLVFTLVGYLTYRNQVQASSSFHRWRVSLLLLLALALLLSMTALSFELSFVVGTGAVSLFLLLAAGAWKKMPRDRTQGYEGNQGIAGAAASLGAASAGILSLVFGSTFIHAVAITLHFSLALIAAILLVRALHEARVHQNAA
jgi:hypothetical protein